MLSPGARPTAGKGYVSVLVIDPKPQSRSVLKGSLRGLDFVDSVLERSSPQDLLQILSETQVHLVMIEADLGTEDPFKIVSEVRRSPTVEKPCFILMSTQIPPDTRAKGIAAGINGFLTKPFDQISLERTVKEALDIRPGSAQPGTSRDPAVTAVNREILERLRKVHLFAGFTDAELVRLLKICQMRQFIANQYVFREGEPGDKMYVLVAGQVDIRQTRNGTERVLVKMNPGDCFGEMAIIDSGARSADAYAVTPCMVIEVQSETVNRDDDPIALKMVRQLAILLVQKIRRMSQ
jgi:CheY-like chemotaxis protein